jgi:putative FmdB family regulatory protein
MLMPLYEYQCRGCGTVNEYLVGVGSDAPALECESCGSTKLEKMMSIVSVSRGSAPEMGCGDSCACEGGGCGEGVCACGA